MCAVPIMICNLRQMLKRRVRSSPCGPVHSGRMTSSPFLCMQSFTTVVVGGIHVTKFSLVISYVVHMQCQNLSERTLCHRFTVLTVRKQKFAISDMGDTAQVLIWALGAQRGK